jgi:putative ABC transport system permease protein
MFKEILRMSFSSLGVNKLRSFLTMSGITIGVFSVIGVMTVVSAMRGSIESGLNILGTNAFQFQKFPTGFNNGNNRKYRLRRNLTLNEGLRYQRLMEGVADVVSLELYDFGSIAQATYQNRKSTPGITFGGGNQHFLAANSYAIEYGRNFTESEVALGRPVAVVGASIAKSLFPTESPMGKIIKIRGRTYTVIGQLVERGSSFGNDQDSIVVVPITRFAMEFGNDRQSLNIATQALSQEVYYETIDKAITAMRIARGLKPVDENDFELFSNESLIAQFAKVANAVSSGAFVISAIALLAAGVGIMNIMLVSVTERTKEIGLRLAIGALEREVLMQFLIEAVVLAALGGLVGIVLATGASIGLSALMSVPYVFNPGVNLLSFMFSAAIGVIFGYFPARRAARLDPIDALRHE